MDFSSANLPISRDTWAPRSPPRGGGEVSRERERERERDAPLSANGALSGPHDDHRGGGAPPAPRERDDGRRDEGRRDDRFEARGPPGGPRDDRERDREAPPSGNGGGYGDRPRYDDRRGNESGHGGGPTPRADFAPSRRPPVHAPKVDPNPVLGVFGLSIRTRERDLEDEFMRFGDVDKVTIVYDQRTDRSRGFGFITMRSTEDAVRCVEKLNGFMLHGRPMRVDYSATQKPHNPTPGEYMGARRDDRNDRGGYGGGYGGGRGGYDRYDDRRGGGYGGGGGRYDDRRGHGGGGYDRDRRDYRRDDDPYGGRSRREEPDRRRSPSPRRSRYDDSPGRRAPSSSAAPRDYDAPAPAENPRY